jgi:hypothetical protein
LVEFVSYKHSSLFIIQGCKLYKKVLWQLSQKPKSHFLLPVSSPNKQTNAGFISAGYLTTDGLAATMEVNMNSYLYCNEDFQGLDDESMVQSAT